MAISVLLVDDEEHFLDTLGKRLSIRRLQVHRATTAAQAFEILTQQHVDVVVLDVRMPGTDGIQLTETIKRSYPDIEVILLTGHASLEASLEGMKKGAFDYLLKPVDIDDLVFKIEDADRRRALHGGGGEAPVEEDDFDRPGTG